MDRRTTLEDAMQIWRARLTEQEARGRHVATSELYDLAMQHLSPPAAEATLVHLRRCPPCQREWLALLQNLSAAEMTDTVTTRVRAAAHQGPMEPIRLPTVKHTYSVTVRPSASPGAAASITVEVNRPADRERLAGQTIRLKSAQGRVLLQGEIVAGRVSQRLAEPLTYAELEDAIVEPVEAPFAEA
jgi:hypothetical protein